MPSPSKRTSAKAAAASQPSAEPRLAGPDGAPAAVVHLVAELAPFARTGGLGEAAANLARFQAKAGLDVVILMPFYREVAQQALALRVVEPPLVVQVQGRTEEVRLLELVSTEPGRQPRIYFLDRPAYFDRAGLYGEGGQDYADNARRYACFCLAALQALPRLVDGPAVLHAHDWHAALAPVYLRTWYRADPFYQRIAVVLAVHNAGFQGHFPVAAMHDLGLPWALYNFSQLEWYGRVNLLKGAMAFADAVVTVSPTHAHELRTGGGGFGLHEAFIGLGGRFVGITNGIDQEVWNPAADPQITAPFSADALDGKKRNKAALQRLCGLPQRARLPLFGMSARMVAQKGLDLILGSGFLSLEAQFVFLGAGEPRYEAALRQLAFRAPERIGVQLNFTDRFEHRLVAGADLCVMPSQYEPCGLTQMRAQRYGTLPLARRVGGLADTIEDGVTGFLFDAYTSEDFLVATVRAITLYRDPDAWRTMQRAAMARDFGWQTAVQRYLDVYRFALTHRRP